VEVRDLVIYCADVGSIARGHFGWARARANALQESLTGGTDIGALAERVAGDLNDGVPVALGFECPLWVPVAKAAERLTSGRPVDGDRPWSSGAGAGSLVVGLTEVVWVLEGVRQRLTERLPAFLYWAEFLESDRGLFLWEAFVSGEAKAKARQSASRERLHTEDAEIGVRAFAAALPNLPATEVAEGTEPYSLLGAALLRTGWSTDVSLLSTACAVIRAATSTAGSAPTAL